MSYLIATLSSTLLVAVLFGLFPGGIAPGGVPLPLLVSGLALASIVFILANPRKRGKAGLVDLEAGYAQRLNPARQLAAGGEERGRRRVQPGSQRAWKRGAEGEGAVMPGAAFPGRRLPDRRKARKPYCVTGTIWRRHGENPPALTTTSAYARHSRIYGPEQAGLNKRA